MKLALLQLNLTVGDVEGNADKIVRAAQEAASRGASLCVTSELALTGYPPRDLLYSEGLINRCETELRRIAEALSSTCALLVGSPERNESGLGRPLFNSAAFLQGGKVQGRFRKTLLPTYDVFDEDRYFEPGSGEQVLAINDHRLGITICEDLWNDGEEAGVRRYRLNPVEQLVRLGCDALVNLSASPFTVGKQATRERLFGNVSKRYRIPILYANQVGGNDDIVFDGRSLVINRSGGVVARGKAFEEDTVFVDLERLPSPIQDPVPPPEAEIWAALVCGTRDYAYKCGFTKAILGLSGGIDSALTAAVAAEVFSSENVTGVLMPSPYSSCSSIEDAQVLAKNLGIRTITIPIHTLMEAYAQALAPAVQNHREGTTEENIQSRIRGNLLMALSNEWRALLLTTGNKSELAVGYCTIYGDMSGGLAVLADVPKTMVYRIARWLNRIKGPIIPESSLTKPPSAELRPDQTDQDSLPPYEILDEILARMVEQHQTGEAIVAAGFDPGTVRQVADLVRKAEFKRKQAAPGIKVTDRAFGTGWRMPIACKHTF
ncbi:NAD+ synthase [Nitrospira sp. Kam-Ns4a]